MPAGTPGRATPPAHEALPVTRTSAISPSDHPRMARLRLQTAQVAPGSVYNGPDGMAKILRDWGCDMEPQECLWVVTWDTVRMVRDVVEVARGEIKQVNVHLPTLLAAVLTSGCERFAIAHNHPSGATFPTESDVILTHNVMDAANACGLYFEEHVIVGPDPRTPHYSFVANGMLLPHPYVNPGEHRLAQVPHPGGPLTAR